MDWRPRHGRAWIRNTSAWKSLPEGRHFFGRHLGQGDPVGPVPMMG
jgi:hypothetical protein